MPFLKSLPRVVAAVTLLLALITASHGQQAAPQADDSSSSRPNIVIIFTDDQGYGDLGCFGSKTIPTPRIDQLAAQGTRFTSFYAQVVCGPSRSALLTGRYPVRSLGWSMPADEVTMAELLQDAGYATGCVGKWDVSNRAAIADRMPRAQGFDYYYGTLGANDNGRVTFHENDTQVGQTSDMASLTRLYTDKGIEFIKQHQQRPFFLYLAHTMVHSVIDASPEFRGRSQAGLYGDTVAELDHHTGRLLDTIDQLGLRDNTIVIFTSDNGPWHNMQEVLSKRHDGQIAWGSSGPLREGKGSTYEGGIRVPCIVRWPGHVPANHSNDAIFATVDFLPTFARLAGYPVPADRTIDGVDQTDLLLGTSEQGNRDDYYYFCKGELHAVRQGKWKLMLPDRKQFYAYVDDKGSGQVELYDLQADIGESQNVAAAHPEVVQRLQQHAAAIELPDQPYDDSIGLPKRSASAPQSPAAAPPASTAKPGQAAATASADAAVPPLPTGDWVAHGFTEAQRERIRSALQRGVDDAFIPGGAMMLIHRGEVIFNEAVGVADIETQRPFTVSAPCMIASVTKPHTATLLAILADQGKLSLDAPVDTYLPEFRGVAVEGKGAAKRAPNLRECLSHTAGFAGNDDLKSGAVAIDLDGTLGDAVKRLAARPLQAEPGSRYAYSRLGYMTAGRVAEVVSGQPFEDLMQTLLLQPIGATVATFTPNAATKAQMPTPYNRTARGLQKWTANPLGTAINPGGGLVSTLDNVGRLLMLHRNQGRVGEVQIVSPDVLQQMYVAQPATRGTGYGLGWNIMSRRDDGSPARIRHTGASGTLAMLDFDRDLAVVVLTQVPQQQTQRWRDGLLKQVSAVFAEAEGS